jgi:Domain of unknown function (DUF4386)
MLTARASERIVGASGLLYVIGIVLGFGVLVGSVPGPEAEAGEVRDFVARSEIRVWAGGYIGLLAVAAFLVFIGGLWGILRSAEGGSGWVSTTGLVAAAVGAATVVSGDLVPGAAVFLSGSSADLSTAALLLDAKKLAEMLTVPLFGVFLGSVALVVLRAGALPRWAGWSAALVGALSVVTVPLGYEPSQIPVFLTIVWIAALSVRLLARPLAASPAAAAGTA